VQTNRTASGASPFHPDDGPVVTVHVDAAEAAMLRARFGDRHRMYVEMANDDEAARGDHAYATQEAASSRCVLDSIGLSVVCPAQTLRVEVLEALYESVSAIDAGDPDGVRDARMCLAIFERLPGTTRLASVVSRE
jgi:hypothetical protein